jgi:hypothetical protein
MYSSMTVVSYLSFYYIKKPTWCNFMQSHLFFIEIHSTCFGRLLRPSSGVQSNCSYSHRYVSSVCVVWLKSAIAQCHDTVQKVPDLGHLTMDLRHTTQTLEMYSTYDFNYSLIVLLMMGAKGAQNRISIKNKWDCIKLHQVGLLI